MTAANRTLDAIRDAGSVSAKDVRALRRAFFEDGRIADAEAADLFDIDRRVCEAENDDGWPALFVEALTDYVVHQAEPAGYVTRENADWLMAQIGADGRVTTATELDLLIKILETARWVPTVLTAYALDAVRRRVLESGDAESPQISADDVDLLRRILFAAGGDGNIAITRSEAEVLFALNDATVTAKNDPAWADLFVKAVANAIMATSGYRPPSRAEALRREAWLRERSGAADFLVCMVSGGFKAIWDAYTEPSAEERALARLEAQKRQMLVDEEVDDIEAAWLAERIAQDGAVDDNERALLRFIREESPKLHPSLQTLLSAA